MLAIPLAKRNAIDSVVNSNVPILKHTERIDLGLLPRTARISLI